MKKDVVYLVNIDSYFGCRQRRATSLREGRALLKEVLADKMDYEQVWLEKVTTITKRISAKK